MAQRIQPVDKFQTVTEDRFVLFNNALSKTWITGCQMRSWYCQWL